MNRRDVISVGIAAALTAALALGSAANEMLMRGPLDSPPPTPTTTPKPLILTPRPTSTALTPRPPTPTPQTIAATPGPCTVALHERSATCKTAYYQPVTWTYGANVVVTSSLFDGTSRATFGAALIGGTSIVVAPRWQPVRSLNVITLTGQISNWAAGATLIGSGPPAAALTLVHHRWITNTNSYRATFYSVSTNAQGVWTLNVPGGVLAHPRDYWQVRYVANGVTYVNGVFTRRLIFPVVRKQS